jgi:quinoprotein glucose dehydrogenase
LRQAFSWRSCSYESGGRQFVVVAAGGYHAYYRQKIGDYLLAFALPER